MNWFSLISDLVRRIPIERALFPPRDKTKELEDFAATMTASVVPKEGASEGKPMSKPVESPKTVATACVPCALGHFSTSAGLLNEAVRFKGEGITSDEILDRIAKIQEEQNTLERVDLTSENIQALPPWEKELAEEALQQSRGLRHRLETLTTIEDLKATAADTEGYYRNLNRKWWKLRVTKIGKTEPELTLEGAKKMAADEAAKEVEKKWLFQEKK